MSYVSEISNALAARGNALAQGELQRGQVYGNLAQNLGQIPFQALAFDQQQQQLREQRAQRELARHHMELQNANMQHEVDFQKEIAAVTSMPGTTTEQRNNAIGMVIQKYHPEKYQEILRQQQEAAQRADAGAIAFNQAMQGTPGTEYEKPIVTPQNALAPGMAGPQIPVPQRQPEFDPLVHPQVTTSRGPLPRALTDVDVQLRDQQKASAASEILGKREKDVAAFKEGIKTPTQHAPSAYADFSSGDPSKRKTAEEYLARNQDLEAANLRKTLMRLAIQDKKAGVADNADVEQAAAAIVSHRMSPSQLTSYGRGKIRGQIMAKVFELDPEFDVMKAEAGRTAGDRNQKIIRSLDAVEGGLDTVLKTSQEFGRSEVGLINDIVLKGKVQLNNPKAIRFQTAVQSVIDDLASALSGGGATTDAARKQATTIFNSSYSQGGLDAAVGSVREVLKARRDAFAAGTTYETKETGGGGTVGPYSDAQKEARYQEWLKKQGAK